MQDAVPADAGAPSAAPPAAPPAGSARALLAGPILRTLLRLAAPNVLATSTAVLVGLAETFYVGRLGVVPLAALGLVFPFAMLTGMLSAGAMGGGVASAISRAIGADDMKRAQAVALHALAIGTLGGIAYSALLFAVSRPLFTLLGGRGPVLAEALGYAAVLFSGATAVWLFNTLASVLRGTGNMRLPSAALIGAGLLQITIGGVLGLGLAGAPKLGMPGVALGQILAQGLGAAFLLWLLRRDDARLRLEFRGVRLQRALFADILRVGAVSCLSPLQSVTTMVLMAGFVAQLGVLPLAGYAIGQRLEFLMSTVAFGIGLASVPMVGMAVGAGLVARARRVAWAAASVTALILGVVGLVVAIHPDLWAAIFTAEPQVLGYAQQYLRWTGPAYPFYGFGLTLYFASQGAGRMAGPVAAATMRLVVVAAGGGWLVAHAAAPWQLFVLSAASMVAYGGTCALALRLDRWGSAR